MCVRTVARTINQHDGPLSALGVQTNAGLSVQGWCGVQPSLSDEFG